MAENFDWANYDWGQGTPGLMARPKNDAMSMGLLAAGLGILANNRGNYGQLAPALGAGGLQGLSTYSNMLQQDRQSKMDESRLNMEQQRQQLLMQQMEQQKLAMAKQRAQKDYFQNAFGGGGGQLAQGAALGDVGPTNTNAARSTGNPMDMLTPEQRFIVQGHIGAENYPEALKAMNEYLKPIVAGDKVLQIRNGMAQPVPGSVQTHGAFTRESERAKGEFTPFMGVQNEQGQAVPMTTAGFAERFGRSQAAPQQSGPTGLDGLPPEIANAIKNDMMRTGVKSANYQFGPTDAKAGTPVSPANIRTGQISMGQPSAGGMPAVSGPTIEGKALAEEKAKAALDLVPTYNPETRQMELKPRLGLAEGTGGAGVVSAPDPLRTKASEGLNEDWIKRVYPAVNAAGDAANGMIANLDALKNINMKTGWGTEAKAAAANVLSGLGIGGSNANLYAANAQKFQSIASTRLWEVLNQAKGPQTEGDANRAKATFAQLTNTQEANDFIVDFARAMANRDRTKARFYNEAMPIAREDGDLTAVDRKWQQIQGSVWDDPALARWKK
jgi:hypothetical protein